jgi:hypothetical protein
MGAMKQQMLEDRITMLSSGMTGGLPARYRPDCVALFLFLAPLSDGQARGFFANVDSDSLGQFWAFWSSTAEVSGRKAGMTGDAVIMTSSMLHDSLKRGLHREAKPRAMLAQTALWLFAEQFARNGELDLMLRGDAAVSMTLQETNKASFDIRTAFADLLTLG